MMFESEQSVIKSLIGDFIRGGIEHVGSTAVVGLAAKPVIDIMVGVESLDASKPAIAIMQGNGYCYHPYKGEVMHWFCKPRPEIRTHHLHLVPFQSKLWYQRLAFRDCLRSNHVLGKEYENLKYKLAKKCKDDRELYTSEKSAFVARVLTQVSMS